MMDSTTRAHTGKTAATAKAMARLKTRRTLRRSKSLSCGSNGGSIGFHLVFDSVPGLLGTIVTRSQKDCQGRTESETLSLTTPLNDSLFFSFFFSLANIAEF